MKPAKTVADRLIMTVRYFSLRVASALSGLKQFFTDIPIWPCLWCFSWMQPFRGFLLEAGESKIPVETVMQMEKLLGSIYPNMLCCQADSTTIFSRFSKYSKKAGLFQGREIRGKLREKKIYFKTPLQMRSSRYRGVERSRYFHPGRGERESPL